MCAHKETHVSSSPKPPTHTDENMSVASSKPSEWQRRVLPVACTCVFARMVRHTTVCLTSRMCVRVCECVCVDFEGFQLVRCVPSLVMFMFRSQSLVAAGTPLTGSGCSGPRGPTPHPTRPNPCLVDPPLWGLLPYPHSTHTPSH